MNARFAAGHPANDFKSAGVVVRVADLMSNQESPWLPAYGQSDGDRFSVSIVNRNFPTIFHNEWTGIIAPGFVYASTPKLRDRVLCSYPSDGGTAARTCRTWGGDNSCIPGCVQFSCEWKKFYCSWPGHMLQTMLERQHATVPHGPFPKEEFGAHLYNEIILDNLHPPWEKCGLLPSVVEGVFFQNFAPPGQKALARTIHRKFIEAYPGEASRVPLLEYDQNKEAPFSVVF